MADRHGDPRFYDLLEEIAELHSRKNHDYAKTTEPLSNFNRSASLGVEPWRGVLVRMSDKWSRIEQLAGGKVAKNESLRDSLVDLAVYALIDILLLEDEESKARRLQSDARLAAQNAVKAQALAGSVGGVNLGPMQYQYQAEAIVTGDGADVKFVPVGEYGQWIKA